MPTVGSKGISSLHEPSEAAGDRFRERVGEDQEHGESLSAVHQGDGDKPYRKSDQLCSGIPEEQLFLPHIVGQKAETGA